jgi:rhodanese-related sulfurtransferase
VRALSLVGEEREAPAAPALPSELPPGTVLLDLRDHRSFRSGHHPAATHLEYAEALRLYRSLDPTKVYIAVCEVGLKSAHLVRLMREAGFEAYHVPRGVRGLAPLAPPF